MIGCGVGNSVMSDVRQFHRQLKEEGLMSQIHGLKRSRLSRTLLSFVTNWGIIAVSLILSLRGSVWWGLVAIPVIGSRQRAMSNLVHDASHNNLTENRLLNDRLADLLSAFPMFETVNNYRKSHMRHHLYLGVPGQDPDLESHRRYGFDDLKPSMDFSLLTYLGLVFNIRSWRDSVLGSFLDLPLREKGFVAAWWMCSLTVISLFNLELGFQIATVWIISRATSYHLIRIFAEFMDHAGLQPGSVFGFTRNIPGGAWLFRTLFHPLSDNFHLVHHLIPQIPHYGLKAAHRVLMQNQTYQLGHHCDGYFSGRYSAVSSWSKARGIS
jgi:fatty acid desaturase